MKTIKYACTLSIFALAYAFAHPKATSPDQTSWKVHSEPSATSPSEQVEIKNWRVETSEWYRLSDIEQGKSYWVHQDELKKKGLNLSFSTEKKQGSWTEKHSLSHQGFSGSWEETQTWGSFQKTFAHMRRMTKPPILSMKSKRHAWPFPSTHSMAQSMHLGLKPHGRASCHG